MSIEQHVVASLDAEIDNATVRYQVIEQGSDRNAPAAPYVTVQRIGSLWSDLDTICAMNTELAQVQLQIDIYSPVAAEARMLADTVRNRLAAFDIPPGLDSEVDFYEPDTRLHRVAATYTFWDYDPELVLETGRSYSNAYSSAFG